jgi:serine protease Do
MNRLARAALVFVLVVVVPQLVAQFSDTGFDDGDSRRPLPEPGIGAPPAPETLGPPAERVRRPLPQPGPDDPLFSVETEALNPGEVAFGTSFAIAPGAWLTARHVANGDCRRVMLIVDGRKVPAQIAYLHPQADLALLRTPNAGGPALPLETAAVEANETGYTFGFPKERLGATQDRLMGRARMRLGGAIRGVGPVLTWAEIDRYPQNLPALSGMSGGPVLDEHGKVLGIMVAASVRRGRIHTVAPEILQATARSFALTDASAKAEPVGDVAMQSVSLSDTASALSKSSRIVPTYCIPAS